MPIFVDVTGEMPKSEEINGFVFKCAIGEIKVDEIKAKMLAEIAAKCGKFTAIRALRYMSNIGLRDAKLIIEWLMGHYDWIEW